MLLQLVLNHPEALGPILRTTPAWVWALLAGLLALGLSQLREREASLVRVSALPVAMTVFSVWGAWSALGASPHALAAGATWAAAAFLVFATVAPGHARAQFDPVRRSYRLPGSVVPLLLVVGIFLVKYVVGVELALAPQRVREFSFVLGIAGLYGALTGVFVGRATRLWRLALRATSAA